MKDDIENSRQIYFKFYWLQSIWDIWSLYWKCPLSKVKFGKFKNFPRILFFCQFPYQRGNVVSLLFNHLRCEQLLEGANWQAEVDSCISEEALNVLDQINSTVCSIMLELHLRTDSYHVFLAEHILLSSIYLCLPLAWKIFSQGLMDLCHTLARQMRNAVKCQNAWVHVICCDTSYLAWVANYTNQPGHGEVIIMTRKKCTYQWDFSSSLIGTTINFFSKMFNFFVHFLTLLYLFSAVERLGFSWWVRIRG